MRIVGGRFRGTALASVGAGDVKAHLRPTTDRVRETLFNLLAHGPYGDPVSGARVLDLFAGTGALGLEALSRGASAATFVDDGRKAGALIKANVETLGLASQTRLVRKDAQKLGTCPSDPFDVIFLDPPYGKNLGTRALSAAGAGGWIAPGALVVWEEAALQAIPNGFTLRDHRRYGDTHLHILSADA